MKVSITGISWYKNAAEYARLQKLFIDGDNLPSTYEKWLASAELGEKKLGESGVRVVRIVIDADTFPVWCASLGCDVNTEARKRFVREKVADFAKGRVN